MARPIHTKASGKGAKPHGRKQLNASLPEQLVLDFNSAASTQGNGKRDALLEDVLLSFLAQLRPDSKSVRKLYRAAEGGERGHVTRREADRLDAVMIEREAITEARSHAEEIVRVTTAAITRKGPKPVIGASLRQKRRRVS